MIARFAVTIALGLVACGSPTLPDVDSLSLVLAPGAIAAGTRAQAVFFNGSNTNVGVATDDCDLRVIDQVARDPDENPPQECAGGMVLVRPGRGHTFSFAAPTVGGTFRLAVQTDVQSATAESGLLVLQSRAFTVIGPER